MGRERALHALLLLTSIGCDRAPAPAPPAEVAPTAPATTTPTRVVVPTEAAPIVAAPPAPAPSPPPEPAKSPTPRKGSRDPVAATAPPVAGAPTAGSAAPTPTPPAPTPSPPATPFTPKTLVADTLFRIELSPLAPCKPAAPCKATLVVHALGGYKVNAEYPTKFVAIASPGVTVDGTGTFAVTDKTTGTMTVTFRAAASGTAKISGALKLSVCTDEICEIAAPSIAFDVPVT